MYDKTVRRRRVVLGLLVASSLILLTAYFGESTAARCTPCSAAAEVVTPIQEGASRALKPFRDLFGWVGDTFDAKGEVKDLSAERDQLREEVGRIQYARAEPDAAQAAGPGPQPSDTGLIQSRPSDRPRHRPVADGVVHDDHDRQGTSERRRGERQPSVVTGRDGLIGKVTTVSPHWGRSSRSSPTTRSRSRRVSQRVDGRGGTVQPPPVGNPRDLVLKFTQGWEDAVSPRAHLVVTSGHDFADRAPELALPAWEYGSARVTADRRAGNGQPGGPPAPVRRPAPAGRRR